MYSLLENVDKKIRIFIIHKDNNFLDFLSKKIINHKNLESIKVYKFDKKNIKFPNLNNNHISEATYYRLYTSSYLPNDIKHITYLDADTVCTNNPTNHIMRIQSKLDDNKSIAVKTEMNRQPDTSALFDKLQMSSNKYFNAGVMVINLDLWKENNIEDKARDKMVLLADKIQFWDQDILNSIIDGDYVELDSELNYIVSLDTNALRNMKKEIKLSDENLPQFIHYAGSSKPWTLEGIFVSDSKYYQNYYKKVFRQKYHIKINWKSHSLKVLVKNLKNKNILDIDHPFALVYIFIREVLKR